MSERVDVVVVGGGLAGIAAAARLRALGVEVLGLEAGAALGGKATTVETPKGRFPGGPTSFNGRHPAFWRLFDLLGLSDEALRLSPTSSARFIVRDGALRGLRPSLSSVIGTRALDWSDKWRLARDFVSRAKRPGSDADESVDAFLERRFGRALTDRFFAAVFTGIFAGDLKALSAASCLPALVAAEREYGSVLRGAMRAMGRPADGTRPGLYTFKDGLGVVGERASRQLPFRTRSPVRGLRRDGDGFVVEVDSAGGGTTIRARSLVLAAEAPVASTLLGPLAPETSAVLSTFRYAPLALVGWAESTPGDSKLPSGFGYLAPPVEDCFALGTLFVGDLLDETPRRFSTFVGGAVFAERASLPDERLLDGVIQDLARLTGGRVGELLHVQRWPGGVFQPPVGHASMLAKAVEGLGGRPIALAGSYLGGAAMKDAIDSGFKAADVVAARLGDVSKQAA